MGGRSACGSAALLLCVCILFWANVEGQLDLQQLLNAGSNTDGGLLASASGLGAAGALIGADRLGGKFGGKGLLLAQPLMGGKFDGVLGKGKTKKSGLFKGILDSQVDGLFGGLLAANPWTFSPKGKTAKWKKTKIALKPKNVLKAGKAKIGGGLTKKLGLLSTGLGLAQTGAQTASTRLDDTIRQQETAFRTGVDVAEALVDSNPQTAALKNLIFKTMLFSLYVDADLNARMEILEQSILRLNGYKRLFKPIGAGRFLGRVSNFLVSSVEAITDILAIPRTFFTFQAEDGVEDGTIRGRLREVNQQIQDSGTTFQDWREGNLNSGVGALSDFLQAIEDARTTEIADDGLLTLRGLRRDALDTVDSSTTTFENRVNDLLNARNDAVNGAVDSLFDAIASPSLPDFGGVDLPGSLDLPDALRDIQRLTDGQFDTARGTISDATGRLRDANRRTLDALLSVVGDGADGLTDIGGGLTEDALSRIGSFFTGSFDQFTDQVGGAFDGLNNVFSAARDGVRDVVAVGSPSGTVQETAAAALDRIADFDPPSVGNLIQGDILDGAIGIRSLVDGITGNGGGESAPTGGASEAVEGPV